jgi:hypothetical protein
VKATVLRVRNENEANERKWNNAANNISRKCVSLAAIKGASPKATREALSAQLHSGAIAQAATILASARTDRSCNLMKTYADVQPNLASLQYPPESTGMRDSFSHRPILPYPPRDSRKRAPVCETFRNDVNNHFSTHSLMGVGIDCSRAAFEHMANDGDCSQMKRIGEIIDMNESDNDAASTLITQLAKSPVKAKPLERPGNSSFSFAGMDMYEEPSGLSMLKSVIDYSPIKKIEPNSRESSRLFAGVERTNIAESQLNLPLAKSGLNTANGCSMAIPLSCLHSIRPLLSPSLHSKTTEEIVASEMNASQKLNVPGSSTRSAMYDLEFTKRTGGTLDSFPVNSLFNSGDHFQSHSTSSTPSQQRTKKFFESSVPGGTSMKMIAPDDDEALAAISALNSLSNSPCFAFPSKHVASPAQRKNPESSSLFAQVVGVQKKQANSAVRTNAKRKKRKLSF